MTHASVFSGIGGPEVAATMLGWENLFHCEINPFGRQVLDYWYPNSKSYEDITTTDFTEWRGRVDVLTGGFPCQPFSYAGRRRGAEDDRYLWPSMYRAIDEIQPTWVVAENVAGILTMVEQGEVSKVAGTATLFDAFDDLRGRYELRETFTLQRICTDLESHGYAVQPVLVPACAVGAPHRRDRVFIVARRIASDSDNRADRRTAREDEGKGREERIQERHEVRKPDEPNQVRPEGKGDVVPDTSDARAESMRRKRQDAVHRPEPTADTSSEGLEGTRGQRVQGDEGRRCTSPVDEPTWTTDENGEGSDGEIRRDAPNPNFYRMERDIWTRFCEQSQSGLLTEELADRHWNLWKEQRWEHFPTVPPVHRRNDGLPLLVDDITLPWVKWSPKDANQKRANFGKWRTEALKAYGNAIVPQVMYEIFRAIEIVEQQNNEL